MTAVIRELEIRELERKKQAFAVGMTVKTVIFFFKIWLK